MKKIIFTLIAISMVSMSTMSVAAMSVNKVRKETRFLTDKMAYELNLSTGQYNDAYEINFDFIYNVKDIMDEVIYGEEWALDRYYNFLDTRNDDLRYVLEDWQYERFLNTEYFYRPIYSEGSSWGFRIYLTYTNPYMFYYDRPYIYSSYCGGHYRTYYNNVSFYANRYHHDVFRGDFRTRTENNVYINIRRSDFGRDAVRRGDSRIDNNRRSSSSRIFNDDLYNTGRRSESSRDRLDNVTRQSDNSRTGTINRSSDSRDNSTGVNRSRDVNVDRGSSVRTPGNEIYRFNSDSNRSSGNSDNGSNNRSNSNTVRSYDNSSRPSGSTSEIRNSSFNRSSTPSNSGTSRSSESVRSVPEIKYTPDNNSSSRSSEPRRSAPETRVTVSPDRSSSSSRSSERSNSNNNNSNSRSSESSRSGGRTR